MRIPGILRPLIDSKPVAEFIKTLEALSSHDHSVKDINMSVIPSVEATNSGKELIDDLRLTNKLLYYQINKMEMVLDNLNDGIMLLDSSGRVLAMNHIMEQLLNLKRTEIKGKPVKECSNSNEIFSFVLENIDSADKLVEKTTEIVLGTSSLRVSFKSLLRDDGNMGGSLLLAKDITAQKLADNARGAFLSYLSNELNSPLNLIRAYMERLQKDFSGNRDLANEFLRNLEDEAARIAGLVNNVLRLSKIEMGELVITKVMTRTKEFMEEILNRAAADNKKGIRLEVQIPEGLSPVSIDKELAGLAILHVLNNAIKYTPEHGSVKLQVEEDAENVLIHIIDTGIGITEDDMKHIFDKFYRSPDEIVRKSRGDGLGLSIAKQIIEMHEGEIRVQSKKGEGSRFTIVLPVGQGYLLG